MDIDLEPLRAAILSQNLRKLREFDTNRPVIQLNIPSFTTLTSLSFPGTLSVLHPHFKRDGPCYLPIRGYFHPKETYGKSLDLDTDSSNFNFLLSDCPVAEMVFLNRLQEPDFDLNRAVEYWARLGRRPLLRTVHRSELSNSLELSLIAKMKDLLTYLRGVTFTILSIKKEEQVNMGSVLSNFSQCYCRICHKYICSMHDLNDLENVQIENRSQEASFAACSETNCVKLLVSFEEILVKMQRKEYGTYKELALSGGSVEMKHETLVRFKLLDVFGYQVCKLGNYLYGCCPQCTDHLPRIQQNRSQSEPQRKPLQRDKDDIAVPLCSHYGPCVTVYVELHPETYRLQVHISLQ